MPRASVMRLVSIAPKHTGVGEAERLWRLNSESSATSVCPTDSSDAPEHASR
jgi:hypothetical protein